MGSDAAAQETGGGLCKKLCNHYKEKAKKDADREERRKSLPARLLKELEEEDEEWTRKLKEAEEKERARAKRAKDRVKESMDRMRREMKELEKIEREKNAKTDAGGSQLPTPAPNPGETPSGCGSSGAPSVPIRRGPRLPSGAKPGPSQVQAGIPLLMHLQSTSGVSRGKHQS